MKTLSIILIILIILSIGLISISCEKKEKCNCTINTIQNGKASSMKVIFVLENMQDENIKQCSDMDFDTTNIEENIITIKKCISK
ncbi:MAG: hypothetical protein LBQ22_08880 [Bacteroidales bacterium]|jgi:hypothetical protein|nr:hypothetical protein [Bacteroidales bacterium]